jgi:hypothetical protein
VAKKATRDRKLLLRSKTTRRMCGRRTSKWATTCLSRNIARAGKSKLQVKWKCPRRVASVESDYVFVVENLLTKDLKAAHATRLRFYKDTELNVTAEPAEAAEHNDHQFYIVSRNLDARYNEQKMFHDLFDAWRRFSVGEASWEPYSVMAVDDPDMVAKFMEYHEVIDTVREMRSL